MSPAASRNSVRSWPTQKPRPAPVITTARTSSLLASFRAAARARCRSALNAFSTSGRLSVVVRPPPSRLVSASATRAAYSRVASFEAHGRVDLHLRSADRGRGARRLLAGGHLGGRAAGAGGFQPPAVAPP